MKLFSKSAAAIALTAALSLVGTGCETTQERRRPDMDTITNTRGLQSRDLREMASRLAPDLMQSRDIVQNPYRAVIVMKNMENDTENMPGRDLNIYIVKLTSLLNTAVTSDRVQFVENLAKLQAMRASEGMNADPFGEAG